jgi:hypothetical protein
MKIIKAPIFKCNKCNKQFHTEINEYDEPEKSSESRNMGNEIQYIWNLERGCENCDNPIEIIIEGYEYPEGFLNYNQTRSTGCLIINEAVLESEIE